MSEEPTYQGTPILSEDCDPGDLPLFAMSAGAYSETEALVFARHLERAFELFVEYLDDNAPGHLVSLDEDDLKEAARDLGLKWRGEWPDYEDPDFCRVVEHAEVDLTVIGHTTLKHGQHIASWEWGGVEVSDATRDEVIVEWRPPVDSVDQ